MLLVSSRKRILRRVGKAKRAHHLHRGRTVGTVLRTPAHPTMSCLSHDSWHSPLDPTVIASEAKQPRAPPATLDCFVASLLAMTRGCISSPHLHRREERQ